MADQDFITIFASGDEGRLALAQTYLDAAGIRYAVRDESSQDLLGLGRYGTGFNPLTGPARIEVAPSDQEIAVDVLRDLIREETEGVNPG